MPNIYLYLFALRTFNARVFIFHSFQTSENPAKSRRIIRDSHHAGTVTLLEKGFHIAWKSSMKGKDSLHDSEGYHYGYVVNPHGAFTAPTDRQAFWRCTGNFRRPTGTLKRCWMVMKEVDGIVTPVPGRRHMEEPHLPIKKSWKNCKGCRVSDKKA